MAESLPNIAFVGNPGAGKSTLLNTFLGYPLFRSGLSPGPHGLTRDCMSVCMYNEYNGQPTAMVTDTPGLSEFDGASVADNLDLIRNALLRTSKLKLVFVITFDNGGYLRDMDVAAIATVLDGLRRTGVDMTNHYGVIVNRVSPRWLSSALAFSSSTSTGRNEDNDTLDELNGNGNVNESENIKRIHKHIKQKLFEKLDRRRQKENTNNAVFSNNSNSRNSDQTKNTQASPKHLNTSSSTPLPETDNFLFITTEYDAIDKPDAVLQQNGVCDQLRDFVNKWEGITLWKDESTGGRRSKATAMVAAAAELRLEKAAHDSEIERLFGSSGDLTKTNSTRADTKGGLENCPTESLERKTSLNIPLIQQEHRHNHHRHHQKNNNSGTTTTANFTPSAKPRNATYSPHPQGRQQQQQQKRVGLFQFGRKKRNMGDRINSMRYPSGPHAQQRQGPNPGTPRNVQHPQQGRLQSNKTAKHSQSWSQQVHSAMQRKESNGRQDLSSYTSANSLMMLSGRPVQNLDEANVIKRNAQMKERPQFQDMPKYIITHIRKELPEHLAKELDDNVTFEHLQKLWDSLEHITGVGSDGNSADTATDSNSGSVCDDSQSNINKNNVDKNSRSRFEHNTLLNLELKELGLDLRTDQSSCSETSKSFATKAAAATLEKSSGPAAPTSSPITQQICRVVADKQFKKGQTVGFYYGEIHFKSPWPEQDLVVTIGSAEKIEFSQSIDSMGGLRFPRAVKENDDDSSSIYAWIVPMSFCVLRYMRRVHSHGGQQHNKVNVGVTVGNVPNDSKLLSLKELTNHQLIKFFATKDINVDDELLYWAA